MYNGHMHHRPVSASPLPTYEPLLGGSDVGRNGPQQKNRQLQQLGACLLALLLLALGVGHYYSGRTNRHSLSRCSDRLAAAGLELTAASLALPGVHVDDSSVRELPQRAYERRVLYGDLATEMQRKGLHLGYALPNVTQAHVFNTSSKATHWRKPAVKPILHPLEVPVRSLVLPLQDGDAAFQLTSSVKEALQEVNFPDSVWWQEEHYMHAPIIHFSLQESPALPDDELQRQDDSVAHAVHQHCPIHAVLDRVVVTHTGVIMAVWQVLPGSTEPAALRAYLHNTVPHTPPRDQQPVQYPAMLYTTVGRVVSPPRQPNEPGKPGEEYDIVSLQSALVDAMEEASDELCGLTVVFKEAWHVKEKELMALALSGHFTRTSHRLKCEKPPPEHLHQPA